MPSSVQGSLFLKECHLEISVNFNSLIYIQRIYECEESHLAGTFSAAVNSPLFFIFVQDSIMNAHSRRDLDYFGNEFIFFSLGGGRERKQKGKQREDI